MPSAEAAFIDRLRAIATDPAARGLADDVAVLTIGGANLVLTHDMLVEGVHYLPGDPPADVAWKLVAVNLSDLAAKGARPIGVLAGHCLGEAEWDMGFADGLGAALAAFGVPLLGGDTVRTRGPRVLGLTAIGLANGPVPARGGARPGDGLWVSGTIGDAGAGLAIARGARDGPAALLAAYRRPMPPLDIGAAVARLASASCDVSDGLLIDAGRIAAASGVGVTIALDIVPMSAALVAFAGDDLDARLAAATAGDDYQILATAPAEAAPALAALGLTRIGEVVAGAGVALAWVSAPIALPDRLGWEH